MSIEANKQVVRRYIEILSTADFDRLDEIVAEDVYDHVGKQAGIAWWKQILPTVNAAFSDVTPTVHHLVAEGDRVVVHLTFAGMQTGTFLPQLGEVEASGKPFAWDHIHIFRIADGKIAEHWAIRDDLGLAKQVGAITV